MTGFFQNIWAQIWKFYGMDKTEIGETQDTTAKEKYVDPQNRMKKPPTLPPYCLWEKSIFNKWKYTNLSSVFSKKKGINSWNCKTNLAFKSMLQI